MFRTEKEIREKMLKGIKNSLDKSENSFIHDAISPVALELANAYANLTIVDGKRSIENLKGVDLDKYILERSTIVRKKASKATTIVKIIGTPGAKINIGDKVAAETVEFVSLEEKEVDPSGNMFVEVECTEEGEIGNLPGGSINRFPIAINGLVSVTNLNAVINGYGEETDISLRNRYLESIRLPILYGNANSYYVWAKEIDGVGDVKVFPLFFGDNTVKITIINSNKRAADVELMEKVQDHIDPGGDGTGQGKAPIGAICTVDTAREVEIEISATIVKKVGSNIADIEKELEKKLEELFKEISFKKDKVSFAEIGYLLFEIPEVLDYSNLKMNNNTNNIYLDDIEIPVLKGVILSE